MKFEVNDLYETIPPYGKVVVGKTYRGFKIMIENCEYCLKDEKGNIIIRSGVLYDIKVKVDKMLEEKEA